ncbi:putative asx homology domain containing protein [Lyophyllum shimeji]|uniref:Asx homology domain containing protein n=1 Tax=Lyophyllum shimeji TaxID=47721 RepID=A0A9P3PTV1_LYOSH|nr:putative asx homology domain containing protein [Lyophyllum shimeji]
MDNLTSSPPASATSTPTRPKRKTQHADPADQLRFLLSNPKSELTSMDISDLINAASWDMLSLESKEVLKTLLPPTALLGFQPTIDPDHPSAPDCVSVDGPSGGVSPFASAEVDTSVFTDSHFLAAAHTLQDHIYSDWMSDAHAAKVKKFEEGISDGTLAAPWKDEVWERDNASTRKGHPVTNGDASGSPAIHVPESGARAGESAEVKLVTLAKNGVLRVGDIIAYKRNFTALDLVVEKDAIIQSIHPKTHNLTVLFEPGTTHHLSADLLSPQPLEPSAPTQMATIISPSQLETALLDNDGRVEKARRPNGNAWKCMTVWRWRGEPMDLGEGRWGRENHGTLFYLRSTYYHER